MRTDEYLLKLPRLTQVDVGEEPIAIMVMGPDCLEAMTRAFGSGDGFTTDVESFIRDHHLLESDDDNG
jgi:hypothetical protein